MHMQAFEPEENTNILNEKKNTPATTTKKQANEIASSKRNLKIHKISFSAAIFR